MCCVQITHWLDGSQVYGSGEEAARGLRALRGGRMRVAGRGKGLLPPEDGGEEGEECQIPKPGTKYLVIW